MPNKTLCTTGTAALGYTGAIEGTDMMDPSPTNGKMAEATQDVLAAIG